MNRKKATGVLREILNESHGFIDLSFVSITDSTAQVRMKSTGYEIYIKCVPGEGLRDCLSPILARHCLQMAELKEAIIIYKPKQT